MNLKNINADIEADTVFVRDQWFIYVLLWNLLFLWFVIVLSCNLYVSYNGLYSNKGVALQ